MSRRGEKQCRTSDTGQCTTPKNVNSYVHIATMYDQFLTEKEKTEPTLRQPLPDSTLNVPENVPTPRQPLPARLMIPRLDFLGSVSLSKAESLIPASRWLDVTTTKTACAFDIRMQRGSSVSISVLPQSMRSRALYLIAIHLSP